VGESPDIAVERSRFRRGLALRTKMGIVVAIFLAIGAGTAGTIAYRQMTELTHETALEHGRAILDACAIPAVVAIATHDYTRLDNYVAELQRSRDADVLLLVVVDHDGKLMATSDVGMVGNESDAFSVEFTARALAASDVWFAFGPGYLDISKPLIQGQRWGTLMARISTTRLIARLDSLEESSVLVTFLAAIAGWIVAIFGLSRMVLAPTRDLAAMAHRIGDGELDIRSHYGDRHDEIGELSQSLNIMAAKLSVYTTRLEDAVRARTNELEAANRELQRLATTDGLTGVRNHRFFQTTLDFEIRRGQRHPHKIAMCMIDIDHFKIYNDTHGHPAGDDVLRKVASLLEKNLRSTDVLARYGGEEFAVILLDTTASEAFTTGNKLADVIRREPFEGQELQPGGKLTISVGVAAFPDDATDARDLVRCADLALYEAKRRGRDSVVRYAIDIPQHTGKTSDITAAAPAEDEP
jgi:diguanylate cyclase (GGDEF)-like protein